jgi:hypothetical protein
VIPGSAGAGVFMTLQTILGSDNFGPVHWMESPDQGRTWTEPQPVPALGRIKPRCRGGLPVASYKMTIPPHPPTNMQRREFNGRIPFRRRRYPASENFPASKIFLPKLPADGGRNILLAGRFSENRRLHRIGFVANCLAPAGFLLLRWLQLLCMWRRRLLPKI